jgi:hypothetical protein
MISRLNYTALISTVYASRASLPTPMQDLFPAGWLTFTGRESNPLGFNERFQFTYNSPFPDLTGRKLGLCRGTIARCLNILRAARWITLCNALRDENTGRFKGNIYAIHDEVLSIEEAVVLDGRYINALEDMEKNHGHHRVRMVAYAVLENIRTKLNQDEGPDQTYDPTFYQQGTAISRFLGSRSNNPDTSHTHPIVGKNDDLVQNLDAGRRVQVLNPENQPVQFLDSGAIN